ncbi:hypothetical protein ACFSJ3_17600 [Corallincola platygyrae]|uniref:Uncharacterized protein n=1 Tax=Corallincola platygyrae TaxID=1193278 RepID=A0ABW4XSJ9_9GAMM
MDQELIAALKEILTAGKSPSVALLKGRVSRRYNMHDLISAVQEAKASPDKFLSAEITSTKVEVNNTQTTEHDVPDKGDVHAELKAIRQELAEIKRLLQKPN